MPETNATPNTDQSFGSVIPVLQRDNHPVRPNYTGDLLGDTFDVPQFDAGQNDIDNA
jgi:hypothetical protein